MDNEKIKSVKSIKPTEWKEKLILYSLTSGSLIIQGALLALGGALVNRGLDAFTAAKNENNVTPLKKVHSA